MKDKDNENAPWNDPSGEMEWDFSALVSLWYVLTVYIPIGVALWGWFGGKPYAIVLMLVTGGLVLTKAFDLWNDNFEHNLVHKGPQAVRNTFIFGTFGDILMWGGCVMWPLDFLLRKISLPLSLWLAAYWIYW